jgi:hypothetical protein
MAKQTINIGTVAGDGTGDGLRTALDKVNDNFDEVYAADVTAAAHIASTSNPHSVTKSQVGLGSADNTADANKPISTATQTALDLKAPLASPALTGTPTAPTAAGATSTTQLATTAFVQQELNSLLDGAPAALNTLNELAAAVNDDASYAATVTTALSGKAAAADLSSHIASTSNPHSVTKAQVGLGSADNTADADKPISSATQTALDGKAATSRKLDDFGAPDDNTDLNATTSAHGLLPKLGGGTTNFLRADGTWSAPGGGSALVRGSGLLQGHTSAGTPATAPPTLIITLGSFNTNFTWSITVSGTPHLVTAATTDPADGSYFMDTTSLVDVAGLVAAMVSIINSQAWATAVDDGTVVVTTPGSTGASSSLSGATDLLGSTVTGGGTGADAVPASGGIQEVTLVAQDGAKTIKPVSVGFSGDGGLVCGSIVLSLKVGGTYYPFATIGNTPTLGMAAPDANVTEWVSGRASAALVARSTTLDLGGQATIWAIAEQA